MSSSHTIDMGASMETEEGLAIIDLLNDVSDVLAMDGSKVTFVSEAPQSLGTAGHLTAIELYQCPRGAFILLQEPEGPHRAVAGETAPAAAAGIPEDEIRAHVLGRLDG